MPVGKEVGEKKGIVQTAPQMESLRVHAASFAFRLFSLFCRLGVLGKVSVEYSSVLRACPFRVMVSSGWSVTGQGVVSHCSCLWCSLPGVAAFLDLELKSK